MNLIHRCVCASPYWKAEIRTTILPWVLEGVDLGVEVLEVGPGYGAGTDCLRRRVGHLTCVEIDRALARQLARRMAGDNVTVLCGDATRLSLGDATCDGAVCLTMLHHVPSAALQDRLLAEVARVLRPGGIFAGYDAVASPSFRLLHLFDTMVVVDPKTLSIRLANAGFAETVVDMGNRGFRFLARRASPPSNSTEDRQRTEDSSSAFVARRAASVAG